MEACPMCLQPWPAGSFNPAHSTAGRPPKYPWRHLAIGQRFEIVFPPNYTRAQMDRDRDAVTAAGRSFARRTGTKFRSITQQTPDGFRLIVTRVK